MFVCCWFLFASIASRFFTQHLPGANRLFLVSPQTFGWLLEPSAHAMSSKKMVPSLGILHLFFCWQLLGYVPGGAPFSQLNIGVTNAMAIIKS